MSQQNPKAGKENVTPVAQGTFLQMLADRERAGIATYGTTLQTHNGRDAIQDAMEEAIDLWQYLCQIQMENADLRAELAARRVKDAQRCETCGNWRNDNWDTEFRCDMLCNAIEEPLETLPDFYCGYWKPKEPVNG